MKSIIDLRKEYDFDMYPSRQDSWLRYFKRHTFDFNVFLESKGINLQRDYVWTLDQKRELINSIIIRRHIPEISLINTIDKNDESKDIYLVIDGKQRLSAMFDFLDDKFTIVLEGEEYLFSQLPNDYQSAISSHPVACMMVNEPWNNRITDDQKIAWFKFINFAGTPQDIEHLNKISL